MSKSILKFQFIKLIRKDDGLKYRLAKTNEVKVSTIERWLREQDVMLTTATNLEILKNHFEVTTNEELLEQEPINEGVQK